MGAEQKAKDLGLSFPEVERGYLNLCARSGNLLFCSGHVSDIMGKLGAGVSVEQGYEAAKQCAIKILQSVHAEHGTLDGLRVTKLLGCVNSTPDFIEQHLVIRDLQQLLRYGCCQIGPGNQHIVIEIVPQGFDFDFELVSTVFGLLQRCCTARFR